MKTLLTGATGLVGRAWLERLLAQDPQREVVVLARDPERIAHHPRVTAIAGDLARPDLRLDSLRSSLHEIAHCAADIRFGAPLEEARAVNVEGTRRLLDLARRCPHLVRFAHVSTVYAAGAQPGTYPEAPFAGDRGFLNGYQQTKHEAEEIVLAADVPAAIFRLSSIIGDSSGRVHQFNYFHQLIKMIPRSNLVPMIPGDPRARVDLIAGDWAADALAWLFDRAFEPGRIYHICAGAAGSLTVEELVRETFEIFERHPNAREFLPLRAPRLVNPEEFERFAARPRGGADGVVAEMLRLLDQFLPHLAIAQSFETARTDEALIGSGLERPNSREFYRKVVEYCLETNWGRSGSTGPCPASTS
jgi:nucleoside-diphosphate-sugar epimerase